MHPILARGGRLALYLGLWVIVGLLLAALLAGKHFGNEYLEYKKRTKRLIPFVY